MFPFGRSPYGSSFQSYDPYEQYLLRQELQRRRQAEEYYRQQQLEELNRRRAEQLEYARRQAELQRRREAEALRLREQEIEARRRKLSEPSHQRGLRFRDPASPDRAAQRRSMFDGGVQDLFDAIYGDRARSYAPSSTIGRRSASSDPRDTRVRFEPEQSQEEEMPAADENAVSDTEEPSTTTAPPQPSSVEPALPTVDDAEDAQPEEVDTSASQTAVSNILSKFAALKSNFTFPATLDFSNSPEDNSITTPKLAYTPNNAPLHQYEHLLTGLLTQLDAVESYGQGSIRKARKDAVRSIEQELEELDGRKLQEWRRQFPPAESEMPLVDGEMAVDTETPTVDGQISMVEGAPVVESETPVADIPLESDSQPEPSQGAPIAVDVPAAADAPAIPDTPHDSNVDPVTIPLPIDGDQETDAVTLNAKSPDAPSEPTLTPDQPETDADADEYVIVAPTTEVGDTKGNDSI